ncbi:MAG: hypothetical protein M1839_008101 [Geoglossum umbratile]|nr:MAG: hypothetical protein M1839_008101 [Geoglossum umbratile]
MSSTISQGTTGDLSILRPQDPTQIDISRVAGARQAILGAPRGNLTPETHDKFQLSILGVLELSPNPGATADWIIKKLTPDSGGPEELLAKLYADIYSACRAAKSSGAGRPPKGSGVATPEPSTPTEGGTAVAIPPAQSAIAATFPGSSNPSNSAASQVMTLPKSTAATSLPSQHTTPPTPDSKPISIS